MTCHSNKIPPRYFREHAMAVVRGKRTDWRRCLTSFVSRAMACCSACSALSAFPAARSSPRDDPPCRHPATHQSARTPSHPRGTDTWLGELAPRRLLASRTRERVGLHLDQQGDARKSCDGSEGRQHEHPRLLPAHHDESTGASRSQLHDTSSYARLTQPSFPPVFVN